MAFGVAVGMKEGVGKASEFFAGYAGNVNLYIYIYILNDEQTHDIYYAPR